MAEQSHDPWQSAMDHAVAVARKAGEMVRAALQVQDKCSPVQTKTSAVDLVTETDQEVERLIIQSVKSKFPSHSVVRRALCAHYCPTWIIDPIDGTTNFSFVVEGTRLWACASGFAVNQQVEWGVVYSAIEDKMYTARRGRGAFCNGRPLQVSPQTGQRESPYRCPTDSSLRKVLSLPVHGVRGAGSAALNMCAVAAGFVEVYYETGIHVWDVAAASVIVTEAGGVLFDTTGEGAVDLMSRTIVAANNKPSPRESSSSWTPAVQDNNI
uniref:Inositol-1-monophosphatase n=1 Tax=Neogobius melanostomus TaxID=47308 RepID=A0A8C6WP19_9GOBI